MLILIISGLSAGVGPVQAGVGTGDSGTTIIDTLPPTLIVDQFPLYTIYQGGDTVSFHWQTGDDHPSQVPEHFTATLWFEDQIESSIIYHPDIDDYVWEWVVPEASGQVYLEVQVHDAFGNLTTGTTNVFTILSNLTDVPQAQAGFGLAAPAPNPFNPSTTLGFHLPEPGQVALTVFDTRGHRVRTLLRGHRQSGDFAVQWDGRDDQGRMQSGGVYLFVLDFHGAKHSGRFSRKAVLIP
jgi:hypothetical protein